MDNPAAGDGGVFDRQVEKHDGRENSHNYCKTQFQPGADECCYRLSLALRKTRFEPGSFGFNFTRSILRHSKRRGWVPTRKQVYTMRRLVAELAEPIEDLIDDGGDDEAA
jgi:hypothetical protein